MHTEHNMILCRFSSDETRLFFLFIFLLQFLLPGCGVTDSDDEPIAEFEYEFRESEYDWEPLFTNYPVGWEENMELTAGYLPLPDPLNSDEEALFISAVNHSDDVMMMWRRQVSGLEPNTSYRIAFTLRFATEVPSGCAGIGGAPGEAVRVLAAASEVRPEPFIDDDYYLLNVQYETQDAAEWLDNAVMGDIANSRDCEEGYEYEIKEISPGSEHDRVTTDSNGRAWLLFGTRSGFEGRTELYYTNFKAEFWE